MEWENGDFIISTNDELLLRDVEESECLERNGTNYFLIPHLFKSKTSIREISYACYCLYLK